MQTCVLNILVKVAFQKFPTLTTFTFLNAVNNNNNIDNEHDDIGDEKLLTVMSFDLL